MDELGKEGEWIEDVAALRARFRQPSERALAKQLDRLDVHCRRFIELSPFVVIATGDGRSMDASPRGGRPGFVRVVDERTLLVPEASGNNRIDSLVNIISTGTIGMLFMIPGVDETLRINGSARVSGAPPILASFDDGKRLPAVVIEVTVEEAFLQCAKALMRAGLWSGESRMERSVLPTMGEMLAEQTGSESPAESQAEMIARYRRDL